ncbi:hypothetical protein [Crocinitomix algicola]|uniref:hypothetical protein n=1 Tax=Crocinitomix algicola TaxID=1740263 RepID=UPI000834E734|nr:hypothetical protein [Crocinitomix algicola]
MKQFLTFTILSILILGCSSPKSETNEEPIGSINEIASSEILFQVKTSDKEDLEIFEDGIIPWISINDPENSLDNLLEKDKIVLNTKEAILLIDYPLNKPVEIKIKSQKDVGFSRGELIRLISQEYHRIYQEEEETAKVKTVPLEEREGLINRNETDGKYGIWGHDIGDLDLSAIIVHFKNGSIPKLELYIES